ncbi:(Fe-S)-binding protein [Chloroflexota bacterium]
MLIDHYTLDVFTPPCSPESERFNGIIRFDTDISPTLPYLNATLDDARYNPAAQALTWQSGPVYITFWPHEIATGNLTDRAEAAHVADQLVATVNDAWDRRAQITPDHTVYRRATPLDMYRLLPQNNCRRCGEETCFNFALKLVAGQVGLNQCLPLAEIP